MDNYLFPLNYKYASKFLGIIEYKILLPISVYLGIIIFILYILKIDFFVSFGIVILLGLPPILILSINVNGQPPVSYFKAVIKFYRKSQKLYIYRKCKPSKKQLNIKN